MNCAEINEQTIDFLYGELDEPGRRAFEGHVATCESCRREIEGLGGTLGQTRAHLRATAEAPPAKVKVEAEKLAVSVARRKGQPLRTIGAPAVAEDAGGIWSLLRRPWFFPAFAAASVIGLFFLAREVIVPAGGRQAVPVAEPAEPPVARAPEPAPPPAPAGEPQPSLGLPVLSPPTVVASEEADRDLAGAAAAKADTGTIKGGPAKRLARPRLASTKQPVFDDRGAEGGAGAFAPPERRLRERAERELAKRRSDREELAAYDESKSAPADSAMPVRAPAAGRGAVAAGPTAGLRLEERGLEVEPPLGAAAGISPRSSRAAANAPPPPAMPPPAAPAAPAAEPAAPMTESAAGEVERGPRASPPTALATLVERADRLYADGRMEEAAAAYQGLIDRHPTHASIRTWKERLTNARAIVARDRAARPAPTPVSRPAAPASAPAESGEAAKSRR